MKDWTDYAANVMAYMIVGAITIGAVSLFVWTVKQLILLVRSVVGLF